MTTSIDLLKDEIYDIVQGIQDEEVLLAVKTLILKLEDSNKDTITEKKDFNSYIKVWLKNMN